MVLERGDIHQPTGNLILYCYVIGDNPFQPDCEIIASNVVVSFLKINDNFPVVTFPPVSFKAVEDLRKIITDNGELYDVVKLPDFEMPYGKETGNRYIQERMEQYNHYVIRYVELCKNKEQNPESEVKGDGVGDYLNAIVNVSVKYKNSRGLAKEAVKYKMDQLLDNFSYTHPQYDLENFRNALYTMGDRGDELALLYVQKFNAISEELYEEASVIHKKIQHLESIN
ncbi:MAG: hypothetical protein H7A23_02680 [Leptospiraceae bacterium]|nr:hypothetical protein [Leptospiraceae bacterium]MCP5493437.1 hypothetical protein [Leptospiraceae bacterium]